MRVCTEKKTLGMMGLVLALSYIFSSSSHAEKILFFGDSHVVGEFGTRLDELLRRNQTNSVQTYGVCGSVAKDFYRKGRTYCGYYFHQDGHRPKRSQAHSSPKIQDTLDAFKPDTVIIELGTNYALSAWSRSAIISDIKPLVDQVIQSGARCFWVSMPDTRTFHSKQAKILDATKAAASSGCTFIDSTDLVTYPLHTGGGIHYNTKKTIPLAKEWAGRVFPKLGIQ